MNDASDLLIRINLATCSELPSLREEAEIYIRIAPSLESFFVNWWGRELNRQALYKCGIEYYTHSGDFKPTKKSDYSPRLFLENNNELLLEDGGKILLD